MIRDSIEIRSGILKALGASAQDDARRELLLANPNLNLNGIDFVEFVQPAPGVQRLRLHFLSQIPPTLYQLDGANFPTIRIEGGARIVGISPIKGKVALDPADPAKKVLDIDVSAQGDFSTYWLSLGWTHNPADDSWQYKLAGIDRQFSVAPINFRPDCPIDFDCAPTQPPPPPLPPPPAIDYLAKDYSSFRQQLLDLISQRNPTWREQNPADLGQALVEILAYTGDYLSYFQDAVANEAFIDTTRMRISARRHARLVDYRMHDGRNAWTYVHLNIAPSGATTSGTLPAGQQLLTKVEAPLYKKPAPPPVQVASSDLHFGSDPALAPVKVFETAADARLDLLHNELQLHTWGNVEACLTTGSTVCHVYAVAANSATLPNLQPNDLLLIEEVKSPFTGATADADPTHRQVVRIRRVDRVTDPLFDTTLDPGGNLQIFAASPLQVLEIGWDAVDALTFPVCISTRLKDESIASRLSVARGNIALADHGRTVSETVTLDPTSAATSNLRLALSASPLTMQCQPANQESIVGQRTDLTLDVRAVTPAIQLTVSDAAGISTHWSPVPDLLESNEFANAFVAEIDNNGQGVLRFGDDQYGRSLNGVASLRADYRLGNGSVGNIGAEALAHVVTPLTASGLFPTIVAIRNPLPARDGVDPETIEQVRQYAPAAFQAVQYRAVTEADYVKAARTLPGVANAVAEFRWTGSWYTVYLGIDPTDPTNLVTKSGGRTLLTPDFATAITAEIGKFKLAGYDLDVRSADYVPLDIEVQLCVDADHFRAEVGRAVQQALSNGVETDGTPDFFNRTNFSFGQSVYLSRLYAAIQAVTGVASAEITRFQRYGQQPHSELQNGVITMQPWEIARLDNDVNLKENGVLIIHADGGK